MDYDTFYTAALAFLGAIIAALLALCGVLFSQLAPRQKIVNDALDSLVGKLQAERAFLTAQNLDLEGEIRQLKQHEQSLLKLLRQDGIEVLCSLPAPKFHIRNDEERALFGEDDEA